MPTVPGHIVRILPSRRGGGGSLPESPSQRTGHLHFLRLSSRQVGGAARVQDALRQRKPQKLLTGVPVFPCLSGPRSQKPALPEAFAGPRAGTCSANRAPQPQGYLQPLPAQACNKISRPDLSCQLTRIEPQKAKSHGNKHGSCQRDQRGRLHLTRLNGVERSDYGEAMQSRATLNGEDGPAGRRDEANESAVPVLRKHSIRILFSC